MPQLPRAQIDRLGERLRAGNSISSEDRVLLDQYRRSLAVFSHAVTEQLQRLLERPLTERLGKTTPSIISKLKRQPIALSRIQDIAGGRVVVEDLVRQDVAAQWVLEAYPAARVVDRRTSPIFGYHALHVVIREDAKSYELQIRTEAQQRWAQLSEKFADIVGFEIKYGGGPEHIRQLLTVVGERIYVIEQLQVAHHRLLKIEEESKSLGTATSIDRDKVLADLAAADSNLENSFSALERLLPLLRQG